MTSRERAKATATDDRPPTPAVVRPPHRLGRGPRFLAPARFAALRLRLAVAGERLADAVRRDLDGGLALPGLVVLFALGIALYFELPREPWPPAVTAVAALAVTVTWIRRRHGHAARIAASLAALLLGVAAASLETLRVAAPRLDHERTVTVAGRVVDLETTASGSLRLVVDVSTMEGRGLTPATTPTRITATVSAPGRPIDVGDGVRFKARLKPPEGPVMPGGYDFARRAWFEARGAGGYVLGRIAPADLGPPSWRDRALQAIGSWRHAIAERVRASLPGATGAIAAALMVGEQRAIPESAAEPLRASGLTHIVSISGLHMGLVAGGVIVAIRGLLALFPLLALGFPIKKWAAAAAFAAATIYLLLSGNQVAALRSHLMLSVALLAVMVDRPAITMHTVAVSAALILAVEPSAVMEPSFRMSYLAVIALVASYDLYRAWTARRAPRQGAGLVVGLLGGAARHVEGFAVSSLVAGLATAPVIAGTFFRAAPYSILANMAVLPVTGLLIMPAAVVAALAMPFGLDPFPLQAMGLGIDWMIAVGRWTAALPAGAGLIGAPHPAAMPLGIFAVLWLSAWRSRLRLLGLAPALASLALLFAGPRPDILIGRHGTAVAVRGDDGRLHVLGGRQEKFDTAIWLAADRDPRSPTSPDLAEGWQCDPIGCVYRLPGPSASPGLAAPTGLAVHRGQAAPTGPAALTGPTAPTGPAPPPDRVAPVPDPTEPGGLAADPDEAADLGLEIAVVRHPLGFEEDCRRAALVVTTLTAPPACRDLTTVIDRLDLARGGAMTLDFTGPVRRIDPQAVRPKAEGGTSAPSSSADRPPDPTHDAAGDPDPTVERHAAEPTGTEASPPGEIRLRRDLRVHTSLPRPARPWTPIDPRLADLEREAAEITAAYRSANVPESTPDDPPPEPPDPDPSPDPPTPQEDAPQRTPEP